MIRREDDIMTEKKFSLFGSRISVESDSFECVRFKAPTRGQFDSGMCSLILTYRFHSAKHQAPLDTVSIPCM